MNIENRIFDFIKLKNKKLEIAGLRGLTKTGENEWSFRFTYKNGDFLSVSKIIKIEIKGLNKVSLKRENIKNKKAIIKKKVTCQ